MTTNAMIRRVFMTATLASVLAAPLFAAPPERDAPARPVAHMVYFTLAERSESDLMELVKACKEHLDSHAGELFFAVGPRAIDMKRDVNDDDFDVAVTIIFRDPAAHERYQKSPRHLAFIAEHAKLWSKVRVFDARPAAMSVRGRGIRPVRRGDRERAGRRDRGGQEGRERARRREREGDRDRDRAERREREGDRAERREPEGDRDRDRAERDRPARIPLPDPAAGFSGQIRCEVLQKRVDGIVVRVGEVVRQWENSEAKDASALAGKKVLVKPRRGERLVHRFLRLIEVGESLRLDVRHVEGEALVLQELEEEQRARVAKPEE